MAKKLTRKTLDELAETMTILSKDEQMEVIGGKVVIIDKTGKISTTTDPTMASIISDYNSLESDSEKTYFCVLDDKNGVKMHSSIGTINSVERYGSDDHGYTLEGSAINTSVLSFIAKHTNVEWGMLEDRKQKDGEEKVDSRLFTSCRSTEVVVYGAGAKDDKNNLVPYNGYDTFYHTHPYGVEPSDADKEVKGILEQQGIDKHYIIDKRNGIPTRYYE